MAQDFAHLEDSRMPAESEVWTCQTCGVTCGEDEVMTTYEGRMVNRCLDCFDEMIKQRKEEEEDE